MDVGVALAALFEALEKGLVPETDVPDFLRKGDTFFNNIEAAESVLRSIELKMSSWLDGS